MKFRTLTYRRKLITDSISVSNRKPTLFIETTVELKRYNIKVSFGQFGASMYESANEWPSIAKFS